jgi:hypothetical protein
MLPARAFQPASKIDEIELACSMISYMTLQRGLMKITNRIGTVILALNLALVGACVAQSESVGETSSNLTPAACSLSDESPDQTATSLCPAATSWPQITPAANGLCGACSSGPCRGRSINAPCGMIGNKTLFCLETGADNCSQDDLPFCGCASGIP